MRDCLHRGAGRGRPEFSRLLDRGVPSFDSIQETLCSRVTIRHSVSFYLLTTNNNAAVGCVGFSTVGRCDFAALCKMVDNWTNGRP